MTERNDFPGPGDPSAPTTMEGGGTLASGSAETLQDGGALENDGSQWGPTKAPKTDAADPAGDESSSRTTENSSPLNAGADSEPYVQSDGRANSAAGS